MHVTKVAVACPPQHIFKSLARCAQSALRLGRSDYGVNRARLAALWAHVLVQAQRLPQAPC